MKEKIFEGYKELEKHAGEEPALANAKFVIALLDDTNEKWEIQFKSFHSEFKALRDAIRTMQTTLFVLLGVLPILIAILVLFRR